MLPMIALKFYLNESENAFKFVNDSLCSKVEFTMRLNIRFNKWRPTEGYTNYFIFDSNDYLIDHFSHFSQLKFVLEFEDFDDFRSLWRHL